MKNIAIWRVMTCFSQENISLGSFSLQQLAIIRNKNRTFALRAKAGCTRCEMLKQVWHLTRLHCLCI